MKIIDNGVGTPSYMDFTIPSDFAKEALYCIPQFGHFYCGSDYDIRRDRLDLFLLVYILDGSLHVETDGRKYCAAKDQIVLLDCRMPHHYYCMDSAEFLWFHFNGSSSDPYVRYLYEQSGIMYTGDHVQGLRSDFESILAGAQAPVVNEHLISHSINHLLCSLAVPEKQSYYEDHPLSPALHYISRHFDEPISLDKLSTLCSLSVSHFIRSFKRYMDCTPHEYLLSFRLRQSKQLLLGTPLSIEEIAEQCGFNSASHYTRAFRTKEHQTPSSFRNIKF